MGPARAAAIAGLAGFAVMSLELTAVRLLAPHFGDSAYVWTNVIGVILVALALGAWLGGRLAEPERGPRRLALVFLIAGVLAALAPLAADPLGRWLLPGDLPLDAAMGALVRGSLVGTALLFAPPVLCAGMATPILMVILAAATQQVGRAAGHVAAWSTLGSLAGTFATTHLLVPGIGSRLTLWLAAFVLIACGLLAGARRRTAAAWLALPLALAWVPIGPRRTPPTGAELLAEVESPYQYLAVLRSRSAAGEATVLQINEGLDSFHSVHLEGTAYTAGRYYDYYAVVPFLAGDGARPSPLRVLSLGAAAGTFERVFAAAHPGSLFDSVELDPAVVALGRRWFGGYPVEGRIHAGVDARVFVEHVRSSYELVLVDAYERQIYIPAHVASREFFAALADRLAPRGVVAVNVGGRAFDDAVVATIGATMAERFGEAWAFRVPQSRNFMLVARAGAALDPALLAQVKASEPELQAILDAAAAPGGWRRIAPGGRALTDDRPFLDRAQEQSLGRTDRPPELWTMAGAEDPAAVEEAGFRLLGQKDLDALRATLAGARQPSGYLRYLAGDCRWLEHDVAGARLEYLAARELGVDASLAGPLEQRLRDTAAELETALRARSVAARNGWLAAALAVVLATAFAIAARTLRLRTAT